MDWPNNLLPALPVVTPFSEESVGSAHWVNVSALGSNTWSASGLAIYVPFVLEVGATAVKMFVMNGATASGDIDLGIYDWEFNALVTLGATLQSGTNAIQEGNITDTPLNPGGYWMALSLSVNTGTTFSVTLADEVMVPAVGYYTQISANPLPTGTATPVKTTQGTAQLPIFGVSFDTLI